MEDDSGWCWFPCRRCGIAHALKEKNLLVHAPEPPCAVDEAILKDRILADLRATWGSVPAQEIADRHGMHIKAVYRIGKEIGVWNKYDLSD